MGTLKSTSIRLFTLIPALGLATTAWAEVETKTASSGSYLFRLIGGADPVVKLVMIILVGMSVMCWGIIAFKYKEMKRSTLESERFAELFWRSSSLEELVVKTSLPRNPLQTIFRKGIADLLKQKKEKKAEKNTSMERLRQQVDRATENEIAHAERYIPFLATTGSSAPYIGLFGTVWGILAAFWEIGKAGTSSLAVVGPYIAEALIATALGLAAAIPAVMAYNYFVTRIRTFTRGVGSFSEDLLERISHEYFAKAKQQS